MDLLHLRRADRSHFAEARLCFVDGPETQQTSPERQADQAMAPIHKELTAIAQTPLPADGRVNVQALRTAVETTRKSANPLVTKRLQDLVKQTADNPELAQMFAAGTEQTVVLTPGAQKQIGVLAATIAPIAAPETKVKIENDSKLKKLRVDLQALKKEVETTEAMKKRKESTEKLKQQIEREQQVMQRLLANIDQESLKQLGDQIGVPDLGTRLPEILTRPELEGPRKQLLEVLSKITSLESGFEFYTGDEGILKLTTSIVESKGVQGLLEGLRERGINVPQDKVIEILFGALRGFINDFLATSRFTSGSADMIERGRSGRYRIELERAYVATMRRTGGAIPGLSERLALPLEQMETLIMQPNPTEVRNRWNELYDSWREVGVTARRESLFGSIPPAPTIAQASSPESAAKYLKFINAAQKQQVENKEKTDKGANQPRQIGGLNFPVSGTLDVQNPLTVMHGTQEVAFNRLNAACRMKVGATDTHFLTFAIADGANQEADSMVLRAPAAPSTSTGDIDVVVKRGNGAEKTVKLETLVKLVDSGRAANPRLARIIVTANNEARLAA